MGQTHGKILFKSCLLVCRGRGGKLIQPGGLVWQRDLPGGNCMVPFHSCHVFGIWRGKEVRRGFKVIIWGTIFMGEVDTSRHHAYVSFQFIVKIIRLLLEYFLCSEKHIAEVATVTIHAQDYQQDFFRAYK